MSTATAEIVKILESGFRTGYVEGRHDGYVLGVGVMVTGWLLMLALHGLWTLWRIRKERLRKASEDQPIKRPPMRMPSSSRLFDHIITVPPMPGMVPVIWELDQAVLALNTAIVSPDQAQRAISMGRLWIGRAEDRLIEVCNKYAYKPSSRTNDED